MLTRILITDFVWPSTAPEREVLAAGLGDGVEVVEAPDGRRRRWRRWRLSAMPS